MMGSMKHLMLPLLLSLGCAGCLPSRLDKYRHKDGTPTTPSFLTQNDGGPAPMLGAPDMAASTTMAAKGQAVAPVAQRQEPVRATIYAVDKMTYRFAVRDGDIWDAAINVLLRNYNLTIVDKQSGILTTEWDSYFLNNEVYRNKVSLHMARSSSNTVDMTIHNNVERLRDASQANAGAVGAVWLPAEDGANETARIIQNMALVLNQPPPVLPPSAAVAGAQGVPTTSKR
jgi:hypothetical protein